jgi:hypothetical protein
LVIKAQIPVGPTHLRLDDQVLRADFGEFADSLLHTKTLVAEYEQRRREVSGNVKRVLTTPSRRTAAGEESSENGEHVGYLDTTMSSSDGSHARTARNHIAGVKVAHAEQRAAAKSPQKEAWHQNGNNEPDLVATTLTPLSTTQLEQ